MIQCCMRALSTPFVYFMLIVPVGVVVCFWIALGTTAFGFALLAWVASIFVAFWAHALWITLLYRFGGCADVYTRDINQWYREYDVSQERRPRDAYGNPLPWPELQPCVVVAPHAPAAVPAAPFSAMPPVTRLPVQQPLLEPVVVWAQGPDGQLRPLAPAHLPVAQWVPPPVPSAPPAVDHDGFVPVVKPGHGHAGMHTPAPSAPSADLAEPGAAQPGQPGAHHSTRV